MDYSWDWSLRRKSASGGGQSPVPLSGLLAWYDASTVTYLDLSGTNINRYLDRSGNGNDTLTQTGTTRPVYAANSKNGLGVSTYTGATAQTLQMPNALLALAGAAHTVFIMGKRNVDANSIYILYNLGPGGANTSNAMFYANVGQLLYRIGPAAALVYSPTFDTSQYSIMFGAFDGTTGRSVNVNHATPTTDTGGTAVGGLTSAYIGSRSATDLFLDGAIGEMFFYTRTLSAAEITQVSQYLSTKWAITIS